MKTENKKFDKQLFLDVMLQLHTSSEKSFNENLKKLSENFSYQASWLVTGLVELDWLRSRTKAFIAGAVFKEIMVNQLINETLRSILSYRRQNSTNPISNEVDEARHVAERHFFRTLVRAARASNAKIALDEKRIIATLD
jgi:hypothetical protein